MDEVSFGLNQYCGPAVLSIFTGLDTDTCADAVTEVNGKHTVTGVHLHDLIQAGNKLGLEFKLNEAFENRSLFWTASALVNFEGLYLVMIPRHFIAIEVKNKRISICDNHTKTPIDLTNSARLSQKVESLYKITKLFDYIKPTIIKDEIVIEQTYGSFAIKRLIEYSDGRQKDITLGTVNVTSKEMMQSIAFKLMELIEGKMTKE